jgi:hypothetical protein
MERELRSIDTPEVSMEPEEMDGKAIFSLIAGVASLVFVMTTPNSFLGFLGMIGGMAAAVSGATVIRSASQHKKLGVTGAILGTLAVSMWLVILTIRTVGFLWNLIF